MEIFFVEKMQKYIKNIPQKNASDVLKTIKELENKTYEEIISICHHHADQPVSQRTREWRQREIKENRQDKNLQVEVRGQHEG